MRPEKSLGVGWDSLRFSFHSLLLPIMLSWSYQESFSIVPSSFPIKCERRQHCLRRLFGFWGIRPPQWPSIRLRLWISLSCWIRHFSYTANSKYRWRKNIRIREKSVYTAKFSGFKSFRIQSSHFRFRIQNLQRHDQTGMFLFRIRPLVCKQQNQSGTKTFRIHLESGTISSSVNLV